ncbi:hypothetical protein [Streptomyces olivochromogenes]|uniref:hypothetical protein n=1 Tax=Streptomyces olivochromogenes TaxID=1963 RepID=UPI0036CCE721
MRDDRRVPGVRGHGEGAPPRAAAGQDRARATAVHRPTLAALAGAVYGELAGGTPAASTSPTTRSWAPLVRAANTRQGDGGAALAAVEAMDDAAASDLLNDALDYWTMGTPLPADLVDNLHTAVPRPSAAAARH